MIAVTDNPNARQLMAQALAGDAVAALPSDLRAALIAVSGQISTAQAVWEFGEIVWARQSEAGADLRALAAGLVAFAARFAWKGPGGDGREGIVSALRRINGEPSPEGSSWPDPGQDPAPLPQYLPPED